MPMVNNIYIYRNMGVKIEKKMHTIKYKLT